MLKALIEGNASAEEMAAPTSMVRRWTLPLRARPLFCLPALSWLPGHTPAHEARW